MKASEYQSYQKKILKNETKNQILKKKAQARVFVVLHSHNPSTCDMEARGLTVQTHPWLYSKFEVSLGYVIPCLK